MSGSVNRRVFLVQSAAGLLLGCVRPALRLGREGREHICVPDVLGPLGDMPEQLSELGRAYLLSDPDENDASQLVDAVFGPVDEAVSTELQEVFASEYARGDVVLVEGWRLARTEARLAALIYLAGRC